jgi:hypothetical protein
VASQRGFITLVHDAESNRENSDRSYRAYATYMENLPANIQRPYDDLARDAKYQHFARIPDRILQCVEYFGVGCDRNVTGARLKAYYLFIGVVDDAIDSGRIDAGRMVLDTLITAVPAFDEATALSSVKLMTEILKFHLGDETYSPVIDKLRELNDEVVGEPGATSIESYIARRKSVGSLTAELSFILIRPVLNGELDQLRDFMKQVGAVGCLVDSLIDLRADRRLGLLGFKPAIMDYLKLSRSILNEGVRISLKHPGVFGLFVRAIVDNVRDRFRAERGLPQFVSDRKDEAASVA